MSDAPQVGAAAPDFTLLGTTGGEHAQFTLSAQRGHPVVLAFYPGDETPVCTRQLCSYQDDLGLLTDVGATLWGISRQDVASHDAFARRRGLTFPLLADTDGAVCRDYGVGGFLMTRRAVFVVAPDGTLAWRHVSRVGLTYQGAETIAQVVRSLTAGTGPAAAR